MNTNDKTKVEMLKEMDVLHSLEKKSKMQIIVLHLYLKRPCTP